MVQRWLIGAGVLVVAVLAAVFLIPSPDTGESIEAPERVAHEVEKLESRPKPVVVRTGPKSRAEVIAAASTGRGDPSHRTRPDVKSITHRGSSDTWRQIDLMLGRHGDNPAIRELHKEIHLHRDLTHKALKSGGDLGELTKRQDHLLQKIEKYQLDAEPEMKVLLSKVALELDLESQKEH